MQLVYIYLHFSPLIKQIKSRRLLRIQLLPQNNAQLASQPIQMLQILLILIVVFDLGFDACSVSTANRPTGKKKRRRRTLEDAHGGGEVIDAAGGFESSG